MPDHDHDSEPVGPAEGATPVAEATQEAPNARAMLDEAYRIRQAAEKRMYERKQQEAVAAQEQVISAFRAQLEAALSADFRAAFAIEYAYSNGATHAAVITHDRFGDKVGVSVRWQSRENAWYLDGIFGESMKRIEPGGLEAWALYWLAYNVHDHEERTANQRAYNQRLEEQRAASARHSDLLREAMEAENDAAYVLVNEAKVAAEETVWRWPEGKLLTVYRARYQLGRDEEGGGGLRGAFFTLVDLPDDAGFYQVFARPGQYGIRPCLKDGKMELVRVPAAAIEWRKYEIGAVEDLPEVFGTGALRDRDKQVPSVRQYSFNLHGYVTRTDPAAASEEHFLVVNQALEAAVGMSDLINRQDAGVYHFTVQDDYPAQWILDLLDLAFK